jgi:cytoskeletal protein RodZ
MKEIGEKLKEARESIGVSIDEASEDLKVKPSEIEEVEKGNIKALKDIFSLKNFIRDYAKYLGLSYDDMLDEFNEYLFDYTSQISLDDIKKAKGKDESVKKEKKLYLHIQWSQKKEISGYHGSYGV